MKTITVDAPNNMADSEYQLLAERKKSELSEGDFIEIKRPNNFSINYVFHKGRLRLIGEY